VDAIIFLSLSLPEEQFALAPGKHPARGTLSFPPGRLTQAKSTNTIMTSADQVFAVPVFLVVFREALETVIIVSVLLAFLKQTLDGPNRDVKVYKKLVRQVRPFV
jgi:hypothetical protein